jgi:hypothetical protein
MGKIPTLDQVSAGGVAYRMVGGRAEVAIVLVEGQAGKADRWQIPKGWSAGTKRRRPPPCAK